MKLIKQMAFKTNVERMKLLIEYLDKNDVKYSVQHINSEEGNIIIDFVTKEKYILILAHYDAYEGSSGANDNASGVLAVLQLLEKKIMRKTSCRILFTAMEEKGGKGIEKYIKQFGHHNIYYAINIDSCGWGEHVVLCNRRKGPVFNGIKNSCYSDYLPYGDDAILEDYGINVISISTMDSNAYCCFKEIGYCEYNGLDVSQEIIEKYKNLNIFDTMHCGKNDCIEIVSEQNIRKVVQVVSQLLKRINEYQVH